MASKPIPSAGADGANIHLNFRLRMAGSASFVAVVIAILFSVYDAQQWQMYDPVAAALVVILVVMIVVALGLMGLDAVRWMGSWWEHRHTTASWVNAEPPGLFDYEADGQRAMNRFTNELNKYSKVTAAQGKRITEHTNDIEKAEASGDAKRKQRVANESARTMDRGAVYIEKRAALFKALVADIARNYEGLVTHLPIADDADRIASEGFRTVIASNRQSMHFTIASTARYRDATRDLERQNPSRNVRIAAKRLADGLDEIVRFFRTMDDNMKRLEGNLAKRLNR